MKSDPVVQSILALAQAAYTACMNKTALDLEATEALAQLAAAPEPWSAVGAFLQAVVAGQPLLPIPQELPPEVAQILERLTEALYS